MNGPYFSGLAASSGGFDVPDASAAGSHRDGDLLDCWCLFCCLLLPPPMRNWSPFISGFHHSAPAFAGRLGPKIDDATGNAAVVVAEPPAMGVPLCLHAQTAPMKVMFLLS